AALNQSRSASGVVYCLNMLEGMRVSVNWYMCPLKKGGTGGTADFFIHGSYKHITLPTKLQLFINRWSPYN
ncbi:hypothetical protein, partial [Enterobacter mori]